MKHCIVPSRFDDTPLAGLTINLLKFVFKEELGCSARLERLVANTLIPRQYKACDAGSCDF